MGLQRIVELAGQLSSCKRLAVGSPCSPFPRENVAAAGSDFAKAVAEVFKWYAEELSHDVQFLTSHADRQAATVLQEFLGFLKDQRHFNQHANFERAADVRAWRNAVQERSADGSPSSSDPLLDEFLNELGRALECLSGIASEVGQDDGALEAWREHEANSPEAMVRQVYDAIGRRPPAPTFGKAVRDYRSHPDLRSAKTLDDRIQVAELAAVGPLLAPLSVRYDQILDEFNLVGDSRGYALLLHAHGVQASGYRGARLISTLKNVWTAVQSSDHPS